MTTTAQTPGILYASNNQMLFEVLERANQLLIENRAIGIQYLQNSRPRQVIAGYLGMAYDPNVVFQLPAGVPPYNRKEDVPEGYSLTCLKQEFRRMRIFCDASMNITPIRREHLFIQMLEGLYFKEADIICKIKDHAITDIFPALTFDVVTEAFAEIKLSAPAEKRVVEELVVAEENPAEVPEIELIRQGVNEYLAETGQPLIPVKEGEPVKKARATRKSKSASESPAVPAPTKTKAKPGRKKQSTPQSSSPRKRYSYKGGVQSSTPLTPEEVEIRLARLEKHRAEVAAGLRKKPGRAAQPKAG